jgi:hypothetical protein
MTIPPHGTIKVSGKYDNADHDGHKLPQTIYVHISNPTKLIKVRVKCGDIAKE